VLLDRLAGAAVRDLAEPAVKLLLFLAIRDLLATRRSMILLVIAVAVGVGFQIPNTANLAGSTATLLDEGLVWGAGDIRIEPADRPRFPDGLATAKQIEQAIGGRVVAVLQLAGAVGRDGKLVAAPIFGIDTTPSPIRLVDGSDANLGSDGVLLGSSLARKLGVEVGDPIELRVIFSAPEAAPTEDDIGAYTMTVRGIAGGSSGPYRFAFVDRRWLASALGEPASASNLYVHLANHDDAAAVAAALPIAVPGLRATDWRADDPQLPNLIAANRVIDRVSYGMVVAAISVPLLALLYLRVLRRRRTIAILSAIGLTRRELFAIFVLQSLIIAVIGALLGAAVGYGAIAYFDRNPIFSWEGMTVRPLASASTFLVPILVVLATALAAGAIAAWRAARTNPARILQRLE
jgi:ABC-type lipoprotein release transport system permease subunit